MTVPFLYFTCGMPGAGKTTFANRMAAAKIGRPVSRDQIRDYFGPFNKHKEARVVELCRFTVQGMLLNGDTVIFDSTAVTHQERMRIMSWVREPYVLGQMFAVPKVACLYMPCDLDTSFRRRENIPQEKLIEMKGRQRVPRGDDEGFEVFIINDATKDPLPGTAAFPAIKTPSRTTVLDALKAHGQAKEERGMESTGRRTAPGLEVQDRAITERS